MAEDVYGAYSEVIDQVRNIRPSSKSSPVLFSNAVDPQKFTPQDRDEIRQHIPVSYLESKFVVGFVGSLKNRHNVEELIRAVRKLPEHIHLLIVGDGPQRSPLEDLVSDLDLNNRVTFTGFIPHAKVSSYISACDAMYGVTDPEIPSNPIKNYEYLACARPIITDHTPEFEFVDRISAGISIENVSVDEIVAAIRELESMSLEERVKSGARGREYVLENHTWDALVELVIDRNL
jgi:glycosyltransferase involved in cell wall biosynthesis